MVRRILEFLFTKEWVQLYYLCADKNLDLATCKDCDCFILSNKNECFEEMANEFLAAHRADATNIISLPNIQ